MTLDMILLMVGAAVIGHCFYLILVLMRLSQKLSNLLLAFMLFFLAIRIGACIVGLFAEDFQQIGTYLGALSLAMIGPLFYFYQLSLWNPSFLFQSSACVHLIPSALVLFAMPFLNMEITFGLYFSTFVIMVVYIVFGFIKLNEGGGSNRLDDIRWKWVLYFNLGIVLITVLFLGQLFFFDPLVYRGIVTGSALVCYSLSLWAVKHTKLFMQEPKKKNRQQEQIIELGKRIDEILKIEEIFTDPLMNVSTLANHLKVPAYLVSMAVNEYFEKSFPELLNLLRIKRAEQLLIDRRKSHYTIEAIAYESGFSTLSAFYSVFKRVTFKTPAQYRKHKTSEGLSR